MKTNKKITIVELIVIITILGLLGIIVIPIFTMALKNSNQKLYDIQVKMIEKRAEKWGIDNVNKLSETKTIYLDLSQLLDEGYVNKTELSDPRDTTRLLNGCILVKYEETYKKYIYDYIEKKCNKISK